MTVEEIEIVKSAIGKIREANDCLQGVRCFAQERLYQSSQHHYAAIQSLSALVNEKTPARTGA